MKIKDVPTFTLIELLNTFCEQSGIKPGEQELIVQTLRQFNGEMYLESFKKALKIYVMGLTTIKEPYRINNRFLSLLITAYYEYNRQEKRNQYQEEQRPEIPPEEIDRVMEAGSRFTLAQYYFTFYKGKRMLLDSFMLENKFDWLVKKGRLTPEQFSEKDMEREIKNLVKYDDPYGNWDVPVNLRKIYDMPKVDYRKAATVGLYYRSLILENSERFNQMDLLEVEQLATKI